MKIAIVEDDVSMRKSLEFSLCGYEIKTFKNPADALAAGVCEYELIISDINMPKMDGIAFIEAAQSAGSSADFIIITGNASLQKSIAALRLGVRDFLTKPFSIDELEAAIKNVAKVRAARQKAAALTPHGEGANGGRPESATGAAESADKSLAEGGAGDVGAEGCERNENSGQKVLKPAAKKTKTTANRKSSAKISGLDAIIAEHFFAHSSALDAAISQAAKAAATDISVLLNGPSGAGKEVFARFIHAASARAAKPFVAINMAALPEALCESELFGYCKGAFTDATKDKTGLFVQANGGTLFLDEIGEMPAPLQAKILRAVQEREITPLGGSKPVAIDVRIVSATNINIAEAIAAGDFRSDLFYRLGAFCVQIAPLCERREEILPLFARFYEEACERYGTDVCELSAAAKSALAGYKFLGNIRELKSIAERAAILAEGEILPENLCLLNEK